MAAIDWPSSPSVGQLYGYGSRVWQWNGSGWMRVINANQIVSIFTLINNVDTLAALPALVADGFVLLTHI